PLKTYSKNKRGLWRSIKYRAHDPNFQHILWADRYDRQFFEEKIKEHQENGMLDLYSQEYLNDPIDENNAIFKRSDFLDLTKEDKEKQLNYYLICDLAISKTEQADYSVFLVAGVDENKIIQVKNVIRQRLDGREIVDMLIDLEKTYKFQAVGIEDMQVSKSIGPFLNEEMIINNTYLPLIKLKTMGKDKIQRSKSIQARFRANRIKIDKEADWYPTFEDEMLKFPRAKHDDQVDCMAYLGLLLDKITEAPTKEEMEEEEYADEAREFQWGRNKLTGY
ncbi:MAG: phage terminase large subunit, partial [Waterburya sp.]